MRSGRTRVVRRSLVALLLIVTAAVAWNLRRPPSGPSSKAAPGSEGGGATAKDVDFLRFREGDRQIEVKARAKTGQEGDASRLSGVEVTFPYVAEGQKRTATIRAKECVYRPQPLHVSFTGSVRVRTDDGLELDTEQLDYAAADGTAKSDTDVSFRHGGSSGSGHGMEYRAESGELQLKENVRLRLEQQQAPPADVEAGTLRMVRSELRVFLDGGVVVRQGARELHGQRLQLNMSADFKSVERASAIEDVDVRVGGGAAMPGAPAVGGEKRMRCRKLMIDFQPGGLLAQVSGVNPATLDVLPGPGEAQERRRIESDLIRFAFDEQGRMTQLDALGGGPDSRRTVMTSEPLARGLPARRIESLDAVVTIDGETGALTAARFKGDVQISEGGRKAWAREAEYTEPAGLLKLTGDPRVLDEAQGSDLRAQSVELSLRSHGLTADENVRHTLTRRPQRSNGPRPLGGDEPTVLLCRHLEYDSVTKTARYRENALMRSGQDEIRAASIVIEEPAEGRRRLTATGGVSSTLHPRSEKGQKREPAPVEARSRELVYEEQERRVVYTGEVEIRQGDMLTKSPEAIVLLTADGSAVEKMLAGSPVEVRQGERRATGERGTYTPKDETLVLVGEKVVLQDGGRRLEGRVLTFQSGSDSIRVDGREEVRSEAVLKRKDPPRP